MDLTSSYLLLTITPQCLACQYLQGCKATDYGRVVARNVRYLRNREMYLAYLIMGFLTTRTILTVGLAL